MRIPVRKQVMWWGIAALTLLVTLWLLGQAVLPFILGAGSPIFWTRLPTVWSARACRAPCPWW